LEEFGIAPRSASDHQTLDDQSTDPFVDEARRQLRAPWAAGLAGILFALLFTSALLLMRNSPLTAASSAQLAQLFADGRDQFPAWVAVVSVFILRRERTRLRTAE
jgi:hypothetical protein